MELKKMAFICCLTMMLIAPGMVSGQSYDSYEEDLFSDSFESEPESEKDLFIDDHESDIQIDEPVDEPERKVMIPEKEQPSDPVLETVKPKKDKEEKSAWWCVGSCDMSRKKNPDDRLYLYRWNDGNAGLWMGGLIQTRYTSINDDSNMPDGSTVDTFALQKARLSFNGKLAKWAGFKFELNLWDAVTHEVSPEEAYVDLPLIEYFGLKAGLIKSPVIYQRAMSGANHLFADESMVASQKTTQMKGFNAKKNLRSFPSKDLGFMVYGDLFPWVHLDAMKNWPKGILRYYFAFQNGYDMKKGTGRGDAASYTLRIEANPFGYRSYNESSWNIDDPYLMFSFNWGKGVDLEIQDDKQQKDAYMLGVDGIFAWQGIALSGGWFIFKSVYPTSFEKEKIDAGESFDSSWKSDGYYIQVAAFVPLAFWKIDLRRHLEFKFRFEEFDPFGFISSSLYTENMMEEFHPIGINTPQDRKTRVSTFGANVYFDLAGWKNRLKLSFDYSIRDEVQPFRDINDIDSSGKGRLKNVQVRNDMWILQLQLAI
jgi:hypothetical protein